MSYIIVTISVFLLHLDFHCLHISLALSVFLHVLHNSYSFSLSAPLRMSPQHCRTFSISSSMSVHLTVSLYLHHLQFQHLFLSSRCSLSTVHVCLVSMHSLLSQCLCITYTCDSVSLHHLWLSVSDSVFSYSLISVSLYHIHFSFSVCTTNTLASVSLQYYHFSFNVSATLMFTVSALPTL